MEPPQRPLENEALGTEDRRVLEAGAPSGPACSRSPATHPSAHTAAHCGDPGLYLYHVCGCTESWLRQAEASLFSYGMQTPNDGAGGSSSLSRHRTQGPSLFQTQPLPTPISPNYSLLEKAPEAPLVQSAFCIGQHAQSNCTL